jgi:phage tail protein X
MPSTYTTHDGDRIDLVVYDHYGACAGFLEAVLDDPANRGLAAHGPNLPAGVVITLPDLPTTATTVQTVRIWD